MVDRTLCFLVKGSPPSKVLLGLKKKGFGEGKFAGFGGKIEPGESAADGLPFEQMWQDAPYWLPLIFENRRIRAVFSFKEDNETVDTVKVEEWLIG